MARPNLLSILFKPDGWRSVPNSSCATISATISHLTDICSGPKLKVDANCWDHWTVVVNAIIFAKGKHQHFREQASPFCHPTFTQRWGNTLNHQLVLQTAGCLQKCSLRWCPMMRQVLAIGTSSEWGAQENAVRSKHHRRRPDEPDEHSYKALISFVVLHCAI